MTNSPPPDSIMLNSSQKKYLKGLAHSLQPMVLVGKGGVSEGVLNEIGVALEAHELIKVKLNEFKNEKASLADEMASKLEAELVQVIGCLLYTSPSPRDATLSRMPSSA